jgi:hypothetical protein
MQRPKTGTTASANHQAERALSMINTFATKVDKSDATFNQDYNRVEDKHNLQFKMRKRMLQSAAAERPNSLHHRKNNFSYLKEENQTALLINKASIEEVLMSEISELLTKNETLHDAIDKKKNAMPVRSELRSAASKGAKTG